MLQGFLNQTQDGLMNNAQATINAFLQPESGTESVGVPTQPPTLGIMVQPTPNPNAYKFVLDQDVKTRGKITYHAAHEVFQNDLASGLFGVPGVKKMHFFENVITITFAEGTDLLASETAVTRVIREKIPDHNPHFSEHVTEDERRAGLSEDLRKIEEILDRTIRPALQADGGDVEVVELKDRQLFVRYMGACGNCPSSTMGTLMAMEAFLRDEFHPELVVVPL